VLSLWSLPSGRGGGRRRGRSVRRGLLIVAAVCLLTACSADPEQRATSPWETAALTTRHFEVRLSTGTRWAPCPEPVMDRLSPVRCAEPPPTANSVATAEASTGSPSASASGAPAGPSRGDGVPPRRLARFGRVSLATAGDSESLDQAVRSLRAAASRTPGDSALLNDLAAAYYVRAQETGAATDLVHALGAVERAAALAPNDPVVAFNRALILDRLQVLDAARDAWERCLRLDPASEWGREAQRRRAALPTPGERPPAESVRTEDDPQTAREGPPEAVVGQRAEPADEWRRRWESLARLRARSALSQRYTVLMDGVSIALGLGEPEAALALIDDVVALAERSAAPAPLTAAYLKRAEVRRSAGRDGGLDDLDRAGAALERVDAEEKPLRRALVQVERARWMMEASPWRARLLLEASVTEMEQADLVLPAARVELARALGRTGDAAGAREQLAEALSELDRQRRAACDEIERLSLADEAAAARRVLEELSLEGGASSGTGSPTR